MPKQKPPRTFPIVTVPAVHYLCSFVMHSNYRTHTERKPFPHLKYWY